MGVQRASVKSEPPDSDQDPAETRSRAHAPFYWLKAHLGTATRCRSRWYALHRRVLRSPASHRQAVCKALRSWILTKLGLAYTSLFSACTPISLSIYLTKSQTEPVYRSCLGPNKSQGPPRHLFSELRDARPGLNKSNPTESYCQKNLSNTLSGGDLTLRRCWRWRPRGWVTTASWCHSLHFRP